MHHNQDDSSDEGIQRAPTEPVGKVDRQKQMMKEMRKRKRKGDGRAQLAGGLQTAARPAAAVDDGIPSPKRPKPTPAQLLAGDILASTFHQQPVIELDHCPRGLLEVISTFRFGKKTFTASAAPASAGAEEPEVFPNQLCAFVPKATQSWVRDCLTTSNPSRGQRCTPYEAATQTKGPKVFEMHKIPTTAAEVAQNPTDVIGGTDPNKNNASHLAAWNTILQGATRLRLGDREGRERLRTDDEHAKATCTRIPGVAFAIDHSSTAQPVPRELSELYDALHRASDTEATNPYKRRVGFMDPDELFARVENARLDVHLTNEMFRNMMTVTVDHTDAEELLQVAYGAFQKCVCGESCLLNMYAQHLETIDWIPEGFNSKYGRPPSGPGIAFLCANDRRIVAEATRNGSDVQFRCEYPMMCLMCLRFQQAKDIEMSMAGIDGANPEAPLNVVSRQRTDNVIRDVGYNPSQCFPLATSFAHGAFGSIRFADINSYTPYVTYVEAATRYGGGQPVLAFAENPNVFFDRAAMTVPNIRFVPTPTWASVREGVLREPMTTEAIIAATAIVPRCTPPMETREVAPFLTRSLRAVARDLRTRLLLQTPDGPVPDGLLPSLPPPPVPGRPTAAESISARLKNAKPGASVIESLIGNTGAAKPVEKLESSEPSDEDEDDIAFAAELLQQFADPVVVEDFPTQCVQDNWAELDEVHQLELELSGKQMRILASDTVSLDPRTEPPLETPTQIIRFHTDAAVRGYSCYWMTARISSLLRLLTVVGATSVRGAAAHSLFIAAIMQAKYSEHIFRKGKAVTEDVRLLHYNYMLAKRNSMTWFLEQAAYGYRIDDIRILRDMQSPTFAMNEGTIGGIYNALLPIRSMHIPRPILRLVQEKYPRAVVFCQRTGTQALVAELRIATEEDARLLTVVPFIQTIDTILADPRAWDRLTAICRRYPRHLTVPTTFFEQVLGRSCGGVSKVPPIAGMNLSALWTWTAFGRAKRALALVFSAQLCISSEALSRLPADTFELLCQDPLTPPGMRRRPLPTSDRMAMRALACRRFRNSLSGLMMHLGHAVAQCFRVCRLNLPARLHTDAEMPTEDSLYLPPIASPWCGDIPDLHQALHACGFLACDSSQFLPPKRTRGAGMAAQRIDRKRRSADIIMAPMFKSLAERNRKSTAAAAAGTQTPKPAERKPIKRRSTKPCQAFLLQQRMMRRNSGQKFARGHARPRMKSRNCRLVALLAQTTLPETKGAETPTTGTGKGPAAKTARRRRNYPTVGTSTAKWGDETIQTSRAASRGGIAVWFGGDGVTMRGIVRLLSVLYPRESTGEDFIFREGNITARLVQTLRDLATNTADRAVTALFTTAILSGLGGLYPWSTHSVDLFGWTALSTTLDGTATRGRLADWIVQYPATAIVCLRQALVFSLSNAPSITSTLRAGRRAEVGQFAKAVVSTGNEVARMVAAKATWMEIETRVMNGTQENSYPVFAPLGLSALTYVQYLCAEAHTIRNNSTRVWADAFMTLLSKRETILKRDAVAARSAKQTAGLRHRNHTRHLADKIKRAATVAREKQKASDPMRDIDEGLHHAMSMLVRNPARALDAREYTNSVEWAVVQLLMSNTHPGVFPGPGLIEYTASLGGGLWEQDVDEPWERRSAKTVARDVQKVTNVYRLVMDGYARRVPVASLNGVQEAINVLPNRLWRSVYAFLQAFAAWGGVQKVWISESAMVAAQRTVRIAACSDTHPEKGARSNEPLVCLASCQSPTAFRSKVVDPVTASYLPSRATTFTARPCCAVMATPFLGQGTMKSSVTARGTKDITYDTKMGFNTCRSFARNRRRRAVQNAIAHKAVHNSHTKLLQSRSEVLRQRNAAIVADALATTNEQCANEAEAASARNVRNSTLSQLAKTARDRAITTRQVAIELGQAADKAEMLAATAAAQAAFITNSLAAEAAEQEKNAEGELLGDDEAAIRRAVRQKQAQQQQQQQQQPPQEQRCSNFFVIDNEGLGTAIIFDNDYRRYKEFRRGGEVVVAAACCERFVSVDMLDCNGVIPLICPTCILPLKRRGHRGTGNLSTSAAAAAAATAAYMTATVPTSGTPKTGIYSPWRDFTDRICAICNNSANQAVAVLLFSRGLADNGLYTFTDGYFCQTCANTVSAALNRDFHNGTLTGTLVSRDWLTLLAAASSGSLHHLAQKTPALLRATV